MLHEFSRTEILLGRDNLNKLKRSKVAIFGVGGVGSYVAEALVRSGVEHFVLVDNDLVSLTNINRQIHATKSTVGMVKVDVMKDRMLEINPNARVEAIRAFYLPDNANELIREDYSYIVDAVDTVTAKIDLVVQAQKFQIPIISSMGAGNKLDPTRFQVADIYSTSVDPLAKVMRRELKKRGIKSLKVVYSTEQPIKPDELDEGAFHTGSDNYMGNNNTTKAHDDLENTENTESERHGTGTVQQSIKRRTPGSIAFVPSVAGLIIAGEVIKDLISR